MKRIRIPSPRLSAATPTSQAIRWDTKQLFSSVADPKRYKADPYSITETVGSYTDESGNKVGHKKAF
jgi:hypothetical protein